MRLAGADRLDEADSRSVDVEEVGVLGPGNRKAVTNSRRHCDPGAGPCALELVADCELDLAFEDVERVGVVLVDVGLDRAEPRLAPELEHFELAAFVLDAKLTPSPGELLALAGA